MPLVVADASPLIGLDRAGYLDLLPRTLRDLAAPPAVIAEFGRRPDWLRDIEVGQPAAVALLRALRFGAGESEALAVALERPGTLVLLDERRARRFATERGIGVVGTMGVLLEAKRQGILLAVAPVLDRLQATGFRVGAALQAATLARAGEGGEPPAR